jgi:hypothetical protein
MVRISIFFFFFFFLQHTHRVLKKLGIFGMMVRIAIFFFFFQNFKFFFFFFCCCCQSAIVYFLVAGQQKNRHENIRFYMKKRGKKGAQNSRFSPFSVCGRRVSVQAVEILCGRAVAGLWFL